MRKAVWQLRFARGLVALCALLAFAQTASAWSYRSVTYDYSLTVPDDWTQVADDVRLAYGPDLPVPHASQGKVDVIFQPKRTSSGIDYPCIIVEVAPYSGLGYPQQVTDEEMRTVVKVTTGLDPANPYSPDTQVMQGGGEVESLEGALNMEHETRRYMWSWMSKTSDVGLVRQRQWGFFGRDAVITVTLYERGRGSDRLRDMVGTAVAGSFKFGIGREYQPAFTLGDGLQMVKDLFAAPTLGMAVTLLCVGTSVIFALVAIFSSRNKAPAYGDFRVDQDLSSFTPPDRHEL